MHGTGSAHSGNTRGAGSATQQVRC
jgi:hypothetical protein